MGRFDDMDKLMSEGNAPKAKATKKPARSAKPKSVPGMQAKPAAAASTDASPQKKRTYIHIGENTALGKAARDVLDTLPPGFDTTPLATIISRFLADRDETIAGMLKDFYKAS